MNAQEVGTKLIELFNKGDFATIYGELYSPEIESIEASGDDRVAKGMEAINAKNEWWENTFEVHSANMEGPYSHGDDEFAVKTTMDVTDKAGGHRFEMQEIGVYRVEGGRVVQEKFYYTMG